MFVSLKKLEYLKINFSFSKIIKSIINLMNIKKMLKDLLGILFLLRWKQLEKEDIVPVNNSVIPEILEIQSEEFPQKNEKEVLKCSKYFTKIFYIIKNQDELAGYCIYRLRPVVYSKGIKKQSVIYSIATAQKFRQKGFAKKLLKRSIEEMKLNRISSVFLYVNVNNIPAIKLYKEMGFVIIEQIKDICGQKENCYKMELRLLLFISFITLQKVLFSIYDSLVLYSAQGIL